MRQLLMGSSLRLAVIAVVACPVMLAGCASSNAPSSAKAAASPAPPAPTHDWRELVVLPFGTLLKDVPYRLAEVVLFHDSATGAAGREDRECYTLQGAAAPRWFGRQVDEYSLCFSSDRLNRIEASVRLPPESAPSQFAAACADWRRAGIPGGSAPDRCDARDGTTEVDARLTASEISAEPLVSVTLIDRPPGHESARE
jgi:hypothetical protein